MQNIVVVGAGKLGVRHIHAYDSIDEANVIGIVDPAAERRDDVRREFPNVEVYDNVTEQVPETYTVCVPVQTMRAVQVRVCKQVPTTVQVPVYGTGTGTVISGGGVITPATGAGCVNCN